jgi:cold shock CspA family protein
MTRAALDQEVIMRIGKVQGRTFTGFDNARGKTLRRRLLTRPDNEARSLSEHLAHDPKALIGQAISRIDTIYQKPKTGKPTPEQFGHRDTLGWAYWKLLVASYPEVEGHRDLFVRRLHPYGDTPPKSHGQKEGEHQKGGKPQLEGRWHGVMAQHGKNPDQIAARLFDHLHNSELRFGGTASGEPRTRPGKEATPTGLIGARAKTIEHSVLPRDAKRFVAEWRGEDQERYAGARDIAAAISAGLNDKDQKSGSGRKSAVIGKLLSDHLETLTGNRKCRFDPKSTAETLELRDGESVDDRRRILELHAEVKATYKRMAAWKPAKLPRNSDELFRLVRQQADNRILNHLVRVGRISVYSEQSDALSESQFWTSGGQTQIKESEVFARLWIGAISRASYSMKAWLEPEGTVFNPSINDFDVTSSHNTTRILEDSGRLSNAMARRAIYFGETPEFDALGEEDQRVLVKKCLDALSACRNRTFHHGQRAKFLKEVRKGLKEKEADSAGPAAWEGIREVIQADARNLGARLLQDLTGAKVHSFATDPEFRHLYESVAATLTAGGELEAALPRLKNVLKRAEGVRCYLDTPSQRREGDESLIARLPVAPVPRELDDAATKARHSALLRLYDGPFRPWATELRGERLSDYAARAKRLATRLAKSTNTASPYPDSVEGRSVRLRDPITADTAPETLKTYLSALTAETATEFRVQKGYESDGEKAKEQAEFIEDFRRDMIALAFQDFIRDHGFAWLLDIASKAEPSNDAPNLPDPVDTGKDTVFEDWQALLYLFLHFVPADDVSQLLHQLRKWDALQDKYELAEPGETLGQTKADTRKIVGQFRDCLTLFLKTGDARFDGEGVELPLSDFQELFESPATFKELFLAEPAENDASETDDQDAPGEKHRVTRTRRGLRQILRYNHMPVLRDLFLAHKVTDAEVDGLQALEVDDPQTGESQIGAAQRIRTEIHHHTSNDKQISEAKVEEYRRALSTIERHRFLVGRVYLGDHIRVHKLMMDVMGRLVDFAGAWEREAADGDRKGFISRAIALPEVAEGYAADRLKTVARRVLDDGEARRIRNDLGHFNDLAPTSGPANLTFVVNRARRMMRHDRKRKNAVTKSVIEILNRQGLGIEWTMRNHELCEAKLWQNPVKHLGFATLEGRGKKWRRPFEARYGDAYMAMVAQLFDGTVTSPPAKGPPQSGKSGGKPGKGAEGGAKEKSRSPTRMEEGGVYEGRVAKAKSDKGFGFLLVEGAQEEIFLHIYGISGNRPARIENGQRYRFTLGIDRDRERRKERAWVAREAVRIDENRSK